MVRRKVACQRRHYRRQARHQSTDSSAELWLSDLACPSDDPAKSAEVRDAIQRVCGQLTPAERSVIELRLQGYSTAEVARALELDADVLRVQLARLRQRLRGHSILDECL